MCVCLCCVFECLCVYDCFDLYEYVYGVCHLCMKRTGSSNSSSSDRQCANKTRVSKVDTHQIETLRFSGEFPIFMLFLCVYVCMCFVCKWTINIMVYDEKVFGSHELLSEKFFWILIWMIFQVCCGCFNLYTVVFYAGGLERI